MSSSSTPSFISSAPLLTLKTRRKGCATRKAPHKFASSRQDRNVQSPFMCSPTTSASSSDSRFEALASEIKGYLSLSTTPDEGPLSFDALKRAGQVEIMNGIIKHGGSSSVAQRMGLDIALFTPALKVAQSKTFPKFIKPEEKALIAIGRKLDERLDSITELDVTDADNLPSVGVNKRAKTQQIDIVPSAEELVRRNEAIVPPVVDEVIPEGETLALSPLMRISIVLAFAFIALGYGQTSHQLFQPRTEDIFKVIANAFVISNSVFAVYAFVAARSKGRDPMIWYVKTQLAGYTALQSLRGLEPLGEARSTGE